MEFAYRRLPRPITPTVSLLWVRYCPPSQQQTTTTSMTEKAHLEGHCVPLLGRLEEMRTLTNALCVRKSCLILGPKGIGKTRILRESLSLACQPYVYVDGPAVLHRLLVELAAGLSCLAARRGSVCKASRRRSKTFRAGRPSHTTPLPDSSSVRDADPRMYRFLQQVYYVPGCSLIVSATSRFLGHLRKLWDPRDEIVLEPLSRTDALSLFDRAARMYGLEAFDLDGFRSKVLTSAQGNPGQILMMCRMASRPEYQVGRHIKFSATNRRINGFRPMTEPETAPVTPRVAPQMPSTRSTP